MTAVRDFAAVALSGVCWRSNRLQVRRSHRRDAADFAKPVKWPPKEQCLLEAAGAPPLIQIFLMSWLGKLACFTHCGRLSFYTRKLYSVALGKDEMRIRSNHVKGESD